MRRNTLEAELISKMFDIDANIVMEQARELSEGCEMVRVFDDAQLDRLWSEHKSELSHINRDASRANPEEKARAAAKELTFSGRAALQKVVVGVLQHAAVLVAMSDDEFARHYVDTVSRDRAESQRAARERALQKDRWALIDEPGMKPNFQFWSNSTGWSTEEAVALSLGKEPRLALRALEALRGPGGSVFREEYLTRLDLLERAISVGEIKHPINRDEFIAWARQCGLDLPVELDALLANEEPNTFPSKTAQSLNSKGRRKKLGTPRTMEEFCAENIELKKQLGSLRSSTSNEKKKTLVILFALINDAYGYNPNRHDPEIAETIRKLIEDNLHTDIDHGTILRRITEMCDELPDTVKQLFPGFVADLPKSVGRLPKSA